MPANANSPFLAERLIARLSPLRRGNLSRRIREQAEDVADREQYCDTEAEKAVCRASVTRLEAMLGRLSALS